MPRNRRNGRPPLDAAGGASAMVSVRLTTATYDELYAFAAREGLDVAAVIREAIQQRLIADRRAQRDRFVSRNP